MLLGALEKLQKEGKKKTSTRGREAIEKFVAEQHGHQMCGKFSNSAIKDQAFSSSAWIYVKKTTTRTNPFWNG